MGGWSTNRGGESRPDPNSHTHSNRSTLDKFGESGGVPTFNGSALGGGGSSGDGVHNLVQRSPWLPDDFDDLVFMDANQSLNVMLGSGESLRPVYIDANSVEFDVFFGGKSNSQVLLIGGDKTVGLVITLRPNLTQYDIGDQKGSAMIKSAKFTALTTDKLTHNNGDRLRLVRTTDGSIRLSLKKSGATSFIDYLVLTPSDLRQFQSYSHGSGLGFIADRRTNTWGTPLEGFMARNVTVIDDRSTLYTKTVGAEQDVRALSKQTYKHFIHQAQNPLYIPDFSKTNQPYHPSVLYVPNGWNGYKYWMANTPYPIGIGPYRDRWESVHIYCSNDGIDWRAPQGLVNPIDDLTNPQIDNSDFFSDPHLVLKDNKMEVFYRICHKNWTGTGNPQPTWIIRKISSNGVTWSARETLIDLEFGNSPVGKMVRSHALFWDGTKYRMWYIDDEIDGEPGGYCQVAYSESVDAINWTPKVICKLDNYINPWHLDLLFVNGVYHLLYHTRVGQRLIYCTSIDGLNFKFKKVILEKNGDRESFYGTGLYRSSMVYTGSKWKVYFTGENGIHAKNGLMIGDSMEELVVVNGNYHMHKQVFDKDIELVNNGRKSSSIILADSGEFIGFDYTTKEPFFQKADGTKIYFTR